MNSLHGAVNRLTDAIVVSGPAEDPLKIQSLALDRLQNLDDGLTAEERRKMIKHVSRHPHIANAYLRLKDQTMRVDFVRDTIDDPL